MEQIEIIKRDGTVIKCFCNEPFCTPTQAVQEKSLMSDDTVKITLRTTQPYLFGKGDRVVIDGETYKIRTVQERQLQAEDDYIHTLTFYGVMYDLMKCQYRNCDANGNSTKAIFDLTYSIMDFVRVAIYNLNRDNPGEWEFDEENCPDTEPITVSFSKNNVLQVIQDLCSKDKFNLEFRITTDNGVNTIHIGKFGDVVTPPSGADYFEYGKGNGLWQLKEKKVDDKAVVTRLWVEGGTQNIKSGYRDYSDRLQLPYPQRLNTMEHTLKDGTVIEVGTQTIGITDDSMRYLEDVEMSQAIGVEEDTQTFDDIYPTRTGVVTALGSSVLEFKDSTMDFDLNEKDSEGNTKYLIDGTSAKITFITGKLAGQVFELSEYDDSTKKFKLIAYTDERGLKIPTEDTDAFRFAVGDKYKLTDINMPDSYVQNAEEDLWYAALDYFDEAKQVRCQYELTFDREYFLENMPGDSETCLFKVGDYVPVKDTRFGVEKNIRIQKVSRNLLLDHDYTLTLSDTTAISIIAQSVLNVIEHETIIQINDLRNLTKAKRGWRTTEELRNMVYDTDGYFDVDNIRPNSIDTNMLTVGSKSQQFVLSGVVLAANSGGNPDVFAASSGVLSHLTILEDGIRTWNLAKSTVTLSQPGGYYVFAKCSKLGQNGVWHVTQEQLMVEQDTDPNNYYFQVGIIGSLSEGGTFRDFTTTFGFTRINGNTITTGKIVTSDGESYLDLDGNKFKLGNSSHSFSYNENGNGKIILKNVDVVSGAGNPVALGVYRGYYDAETIYYPNDEVSYTNGGATATYRWTYSNPGSGHLPTDDTYWSVVAQGVDGTDGNYFEYRFAVNGSRDTPPTLEKDRRNPAGWRTTQPQVGLLQYLWCTIAQIKGSDNTLLQPWSTPIRTTPYDGEDGKSPAFTYRGIWKNDVQYVGSDVMVQGVKYNNTYYVTRIDAGNIPIGVAPTNSNYWNTFGAQFESVATELLLAEYANIGNMIFKDGCIISQRGKVNGMASDDYTNANFIPNIKIDGLTGKLSVMDGVFYGSLATPAQTIPNNSSTLTLSFDNGFNFAGKLYPADYKMIKLPNDLKYEGIELSIVNYGSASNGHYIISDTSGNAFLYAGRQGNFDSIYQVHLYGCGVLKAKAYNLDGTLRWFVSNYMDFSYNVVSQILTNNLPSPYMRCVGIYKMTDVNALQTILCADGNTLRIAHPDTGRWVFAWSQARSSHKEYSVVCSNGGEANIDAYNITRASFNFRCFARWFMGDQTGITYYDGTGFMFYIFEMETNG